MERSDRVADTNEAYVHMEASRKEQPVIQLWHMEERFGGLTVQKKECVRT